MFRALLIQVICLVFTFTALASSVNTLLPKVLSDSWWLRADNPASIFHTKKGFNHLKFDNKKELVIAIIDTGIDFKHPFLKDYQYKLNGKPVDYNFYTGTDSEDDLLDYNTHGTHVAGIIISSIKKVNPKANIKLISLKVFPAPAPARTPKASKAKVKRKDLSKIGYYTKEAANYLVRLKKKGVNIVAVNASFGGEEFDNEEFKAVRTLLTNDILLVACAGNDGIQISKKGDKFYPAAYSTELPGVISVGNLTKNGEISRVSNYGNIVSILAPGSDIMAPVPGGKYALKSGTSMATPQVTAAVSLLKALHPEMNTLEIKNHLLKNSRFNESYISKVGSATRLDMNLLFRPVSSKYDFNAVKDLPVTKFYSKTGKIIKNTPCVKAPGSKFLCGDVYNKIIGTEDKSLKSISDIAAENNTESLIKSYMGVDNGGRIIESSLSSLIHSFTKNDSIHQQMLSDGFAFKDLYLNLGPGMLDKYYKGHVIIPVLTKEEFLSYYPFGIKTDKQKSLAYAKYIDGLLNSAPQYLDKVGPLFLTRATPLDSVEASLVQSFPLPINSYIANYIAQKRTPDMISVAKSMTKSDLKSLNDQKAAKTLKAMKDFKADLKLTKTDIAYLRSLGRAYRQGTKELASSLGSGSSIARGISPKLKSIRREAEKNMMTPVKVRTVAGAPPLDKNQKSLPKISPKSSSALSVASNAVRSMANRKMLAQISNIKNSRMPSSVKRLKADFKYKGRSISSVTELSEKTIRRVKEQQSESTAKNMERYKKSTEKIAGNIAELSNKEKIKFDTVDYGTTVSATKEVKPKTLCERNPEACEPSPPPPPEPKNPCLINPESCGIGPSVKTNDSHGKEFLCKPSKYDELFENIEKDLGDKSTPFEKIFCKEASGLQKHELKKNIESLSKYNYCQAPNHYKEKSFKELVSVGLGETKCNQREIITPCAQRMKNDLFKICTKILPKRGITKGSRTYNETIEMCTEEVFKKSGIDRNYVDIGPKVFEFINNQKGIQRLRCNMPPTILKEQFKKESFYKDLELLGIKYSYKTKEELKKNPKDKSDKEACKSAKIILSEIKLDHQKAYETGKVLTKFQYRSPNEKEEGEENPFLENYSRNNLIEWLATKDRLVRANNYIYDCSKRNTINYSPVDTNSY